MNRARRNFGWKWKLAAAFAALIAIANIPARPGDPHVGLWQAGDIVFLNGNSWRSKAVRLCQGYCSDYSHVGIVVIDHGVPYVINADPAENRVVKQRWDVVIASDQVSGGAIFRLRNPDLSAIAIACATAETYARDNVPFDHDFDLKTPDKLFCTEMVWRAYRGAGVDLCANAETEHPHLFPAELLKLGQLRQVLRF